MVTRKELELQGWIYVCCESAYDGFENTKQLDEMLIPDSHRKYVPPAELTDMNFEPNVLRNLVVSNYRAVFYKPLKRDISSLEPPELNLTTIKRGKYSLNSID